MVGTGFGKSMKAVVSVGIACCLGQTGYAAGLSITDGLAAWYDAGALTTSNGAVAVQWDDLSGNARHATPPSATNGPVFVTNVVNGLPVLRYDGVDDVMNYDGTFLTNTDYTVFCVEARNSAKNDNYLFGGSVGVNANNLHLGYRTDTSFTHAHWGNDYNITIQAFTNKQFKVHSWQLDVSGGSGRAIYTDGALLGVNGSVAVLQSYPGAMIGGRRTAERFEGDFAEVIMYDRYLDDAERNSVGYYLGEKYGIDHNYVDSAAADIAVSMKRLSPVVSVGDLVTYAITVVNNGFTNASAIVVSNAIPNALEFVSASGGTYDDGSGEWTIGDLAYLATTTLTVRATAKTISAGASVVSVAGVQSAGEDDFNAANNAASITTYVRDELDPAAFPTRMRIDLPAYNHATSLTNFPALVTLNESIPGFDYDLFASPQGHDLRFVATNGTTVLNHDVETWDVEGDSIIWVQVDTLSPGSYVWAYWGNPALTTPPATSTNGAVWADRFAGVWHLGETGTSDSALDAAPGRNDGTPTGEPGTVNGVVAGGRSMAGTELFSIGDDFDLSGKPFTLSVWANRTPLISGDNFWVGGGIGQADRGLHLGFRNDNLWFGLYGDDGTCATDYSGDRGAWHYYSMVLDENHGKQIYRDGVPVPTTGASNDFYRSTGLLIGGTYAGPRYKGGLDEIRTSDMPRSEDWIWAEWMSVASSGVFAVYNEAQGLPAVANMAPTGITDAAAVANGSLSFTGAAPTTVTLLWGETDGGAAWGGWANTNALGIVPAGPLSTGLTGLSGITGYAYTYHASNTHGETWAMPSQTFTTRTTPYWTITPAAGPNGSISPSIIDTVNDSGSSPVYTFEAEYGYHLTNVLVDAAPVGVTNSYQFKNVAADHAIEALFGINHYTVTVAQAANGLISPTSQVAVAHGDTPGFTIEPDTGYYVADVLVGGLSVGPLEAYTVPGTTNATTITAVFGELPMDMASDGLVLWLDGSKLNLADGTAVTEWLDYSGRGNHAQQPVTPSSPLFYNDNLGPHVYFNGAGAYMEVQHEDAFDFTNNMTVILVGRHTTGGAWTPYICKNGEPSGWQFREAGNRNVFSLTTRGLTGADTDDPESSGDIQVESIQAGRYEGATLTKQVWHNGTLDGTQVYTGGQISTNDSAVLLGARDNGGIAAFAQCDIYELLVYDAALTDTELNAAGYYLSEKYGIAGDFTHPRQPTITALSSPARTASSALLEGMLVSTGSAPTSVWAYWDTEDKGTSNRTAWSRSSASGPRVEGIVSAAATGLQGDTDYIWRFFASNVHGVAWSAAVPFEPGIVPENYPNSLKIQFTGYAGTVPLTQFPALVSLSPGVTNFSYTSFASALGGDLRFTDSELSRTLNYEVENWVPRLERRDVGAVAAAGSLSVSGSTYRVVGSGWDIWGGADEFHYAYTTLSGDGSITARIRDIDNPGDNDWCKSGVMIRENLYADTRNAMMLTRPDGQTVLQYRTAAGVDAASDGLGAGTVPGWLRLVRSGSNFMGYASSDGTNWVLRGEEYVTMATNVLIGLAVTAHADGTLTTVNFDNVSIDGTGASHVWVQVPEIAGSEDHIWAFWGNPNRTTAPAYTTDGSAWSRDFGAVWHMTEPSAVDSTANDNDGTANGNLDAMGLIAGAQAFTNVGSIAVNTGIDLDSRSFSFEAWSKRGGTNDNDFIAGQGQTGDMLHIGFRNTEIFTFAFWGDDHNIGGPFNDMAAWHHWACVYDAATKNQEVFRDGISLGSRTAADHFTGGGTFHIGARGDAGYNFRGQIDEVRLCNLARSQDWVVASHSNQVAGSTFITFSAETPVVPTRGTLLIVR